MISVLVLDIDGVVTEGKVTLDEDGRELKTLSYRDIDAVFATRRENIQVVLVTGEASPIVSSIARRLDARHVYSGAKEKSEALRRICSELAVELEQVCFVGDSHRDAEAIAMAGLGLAPADATAAARAAAHRVLRHNGGNGAVAEVVEILIELGKQATAPRHRQEKARMNEIGIMQGRLSPPVTGRLQAFPWNHWEKEFAHARACGFDAIEWLFEAGDHEQNPLWTDAGVEKIQSLADETGVVVRSVCADYFMTHPFFRVSESERLRSVSVLNQLISRAAQIGIKVILVPVLEVSELQNEQETIQLLDSLRGPLELASTHNIQLGLETELPAPEYKELIEQRNPPALGIYYDVGNATAKSYDPAADVRILSNHLCGIHIKDRKRNGPSVLLGQGDVNFSEFFTALAETRYRGLLVLQTAFGDDFLSIAQSHLSFVRERIDYGMMVGKTSAVS